MRLPGDVFSARGRTPEFLMPDSDVFSSALSEQDLLQIIDPVGPSRQKPGHMQRTVDEDLAAGGPVGDLQLLVRAEKLDGMGSCHGAAPKSVNANFIPVPPPGVSSSAAAHLHGTGGINSLQQQLCRAAGSVLLLVVMRLGDLDIEIRSQHGGHCLERPEEHCYAQGEVGAPEYRGPGPQGFQLAWPWDPEAPFPLPPVFCFARVQSLGDRPYLVFQFQPGGIPRIEE